jgi:hypothetical protein
MSFVIGILNTVALGGIFYFTWRRLTGLKNIFLVAFALKIAAGVCVGLIYKYYYTVGDTFHYFNDGKLLADVARSDFSQYLSFLFDSTGIQGLENQTPRALYFSKLVSIFNILTFDNYWIISIYFSTVSFAASWFLFRQLSHHIPVITIPSAVAFLFFPSVVFWSSGVVKESVSTAAVFYLSAIFVKVWFNDRVRLIEWLIVPVAGVLLWSLKYYIIATFMIVAATALLFKFVAARYVRDARVGIAAYVAMLVIPGTLVIFLHPNLYPQQLLEIIVENNQTFLRLSAPGDAIVFDDLQPNFWSVIKNSPQALFSGLYRPLLWEADNLFQLVSALENFILFAVTLFSLRYLTFLVKSEHRILVCMCVVYILALCIFLTLSSPNFGTLSRYRVAYLPFFILLTLGSRPLLNLVNRAFGSQLH